MLQVRETFNSSLREHSVANSSSSSEMTSISTETSPCTPCDPNPPHTGPSPCLRVITYNTLAEPFAISDYAVKSMFQYCPLPYLETEYRLQMVLQELLAYRGDAICLQVIPLLAILLHLPATHLYYIHTLLLQLPPSTPSTRFWPITVISPDRNVMRKHSNIISNPLCWLMDMTVITPTSRRVWWKVVQRLHDRLCWKWCAEWIYLWKMCYERWTLGNDSC